jgi:hypothetical protein
MGPTSKPWILARFGHPKFTMEPRVRKETFSADGEKGLILPLVWGLSWHVVQAWDDQPAFHKDHRFSKP